ncbi:unnamed protein product, partial [Ectocarpus sp. 8 AP-2014]
MTMVPYIFDDDVISGRHSDRSIDHGSFVEKGERTFERERDIPTTSKQLRADRLASDCCSFGIWTTRTTFRYLCACLFLFVPPGSKERTVDGVFSRSLRVLGGQTPRARAPQIHAQSTHGMKTSQPPHSVRAAGGWEGVQPATTNGAAANLSPTDMHTCLLFLPINHSFTLDF